MTATMSSNGHRSTGDMARDVWSPGMSGNELARRLTAKTGNRVPDETGRYWARKLRAEEPGGNTVTLPAATQPATVARPRRAPAHVAAGSRAPRPRGRAGNPGLSLRVGSHLTKWVVLAVTALWSYVHVTDLAIQAGHGWLAYLAPIPLDGLVAACVYTIVTDRKRGRHGHPLAWAGAAAGGAATVAANVLSVWPGLVDLQIIAAVFAGFAPVALLVVVVLDAHDKADQR